MGSGKQLTSIDSEQFAEALVRTWHRPLRRYAFYLLDGDLRGDDLDIVEETLAICWRRVVAGTWSCGIDHDIRGFGPSLYRTARQLILNRNRKSRCSHESDLDESISNIRVDEHPGVQDELIEDERSRAVRLAVAELPLSFREVVTLRHLEGLSVDEVAEILNIPAGTVKSRCARALQVLRQKLKNWCDDTRSRAHRG